MFFPDLSGYSYGLPRSLPDVLNVAWLDGKHPFNQGNVPVAFCEQLRRCLGTAKANQLRGFHECNICGGTGSRQSLVIGSGVFWLGAAEIWLPAPDGKVFAAPNLIVHYVDAHNYLPPNEFIDVVMESDRLRGWDAEQVYEARTAPLWISNE